MTHRTVGTVVLRLLLPLMALAAVALSSGSAARAGGFGLFVELPTSPGVASRYTPEQLKDGLLIVRALGCHGPGSLVAAKAEGLVDGVRVSRNVTLQSLGGDSYLVRRQWPDQGVWALSISAKSASPVGPPAERFHPVVNVLVEFDAYGGVRNVKRVSQPDSPQIRQVVKTRPLTNQNKAQEINAALRTLASLQAASAAR